MTTDPGQAVQPADEEAAPEKPAGARARLRHVLQRRGVPDPKHDPDNEFPMSQDELVAQLQTDDADRAAEVLEEAREIAARMVDDRIDGVERRASALQGVVAVAASFSLGAGTLIIVQVQGTVWQLLFGLLTLNTAVGFALCALSAGQAANRVFRYSTPRRDALLDRSQQALADSRIQRAAHLLRAAGYNSRFARWKVAKLKQAARYLQRALVSIPLLVLALTVYAITS